MLVRAHTADYAQQESLPLPLDFDELLSTVSEAFALQRGSVRIRSKHAPTDLWVVLASQSQLMDAVREASESAMHMLTIEVSGRSARRTLDALMFALDLARLGAQVAYLWWLSEEGLSLTLGPYTVSPAAALGVLLLLSVLANSIVALSVLVTELSENGALRRWFGGARGRIAPLLCSPLTLETLPLVASGVCGLDAPLRAATRDGIIQWGVVGLLVHDVLVLLLVVGVHGLPGTSPLAPLAAVCLGTTALNVALNLPRRLVHFIVGAYRKSFEAYLAEHGTPPPLRAPPPPGVGRTDKERMQDREREVPPPPPPMPAPPPRAPLSSPPQPPRSCWRRRWQRRSWTTRRTSPGSTRFGTRIHRSMSPGRRAVFTHRRPSSACMCVLRATPPPPPRSPSLLPPAPSSSVLPLFLSPGPGTQSRHGVQSASHAPSSRALLSPSLTRPLQPLPPPPPSPPPPQTPPPSLPLHTHTPCPHPFPLLSPPLLSPPSATR